MNDERPLKTIYVAVINGGQFSLSSITVVWAYIKRSEGDIFDLVCRMVLLIMKYMLICLRVLERVICVRSFVSVYFCVYVLESRVL